MNTSFDSLEDALRYANKMHEAIREDGVYHEDRLMAWHNFLCDIAEHLGVDAIDVMHMAFEYL